MHTKQFFKSLLTCIFAIFVCAASLAQEASTPTAQELVATGKTLKVQGSNVRALTCYIQAHTADKTLTEAKDNMDTLLEVVTSGDFGSAYGSSEERSARELMLLRNDWDKLLLAATRLMATNPSVLELYYDEIVQPLEMTAQDYQNNTISLLVSVPYLREYTSPRK